MFATFAFCLLLSSHAAAQLTTAPPTDESLQCSGTGELVFEGDGRFSIVRDTGTAGDLTCRGDVSFMANSTLYTRIISDGMFACSSSSSVRLCGLGDAQLITSDGPTSVLQCNGVPLSPPAISSTFCVGNGSFSVEGFGNYSIRVNGTVSCTGSVMMISSYYTAAGDFLCKGNGQYTISGNGELSSVSAESGNCTASSSAVDYCTVSGEYSLGGDGTYTLSTQSRNISCFGDAIVSGSYVTTFGVFFCQGQDVLMLNGSGLLYRATGDNFNNCTSLVDNISPPAVANFSVRTTCMGAGANAFIGNGEFYIMINNSTPNSGLVCDGIVNEVTMSSGVTFTQSFGPFRCISSGDLSINGTGVIEGDDILCTVRPVTGEPFECSGTGEFEIIGSGFFDIIAIPEITCTGIGESSLFDMGETFVSRGSFACNGSEFFTLNGTGDIESVTTVRGNHNCTDVPVTSGSGVIDVVTCTGEGDYIVVGDGNFYINQTGPGMLQCSGEVISGVNTSQRAEYFTNGEFSCSISGIVYFTGMGRAEVVNASASYECNGIFFPGPTVEPPFSGFAGDEIDCIAYGEVVIVGNGQIEVVGQSSIPLDCQGAFSSDLDQNIVVSTGDFMCTAGSGFVQITGRGEVFVNSTGFNNCTHRDSMISDTPLMCSGLGEHEIFGSANATIFASDVLVCNGDVFPLTSPNGLRYYIGGNYRCISHGLFSINGVGNATILSKPNATAESNYSCAGPQSLSCATFSVDDENVTVIGEGEFTIIGDEQLYCTGSAVLCPGEINYYFTEGYFYCSSDVFVHINGTGTIENITGANNCSGVGFGAPPITSGTLLTPRASCIGFGDQYQFSGNGTFNSSRLLGTLNCNVRLQEPNSDVYIFSSNEESFNCSGSGIFAFNGTGDSVIILDNGYFNCDNLTPSTSVITTTPPTVTTSMSITVSTTVTSVSTATSTPTTGVTVSASPSTSVSTPTTSVSTPTTSVSTPTTSVSTPTTGVSTPTTGVSTPTTGVSTPTTGVSTPTASVSTPTTGVSTPTTGVSTPTTSMSTLTASVSTPTTSLSTSLPTPTTSIATSTISVATPTTSVATSTTSVLTTTTTSVVPTVTVSIFCHCYDYSTVICIVYHSLQ